MNSTGQVQNNLRGKEENYKCSFKNFFMKDKRFIDTMSIPKFNVVNQPKLVDTPGRSFDDQKTASRISNTYTKKKFTQNANRKKYYNKTRKFDYTCNSHCENTTSFTQLDNQKIYGNNSNPSFFQPQYYFFQVFSTAGENLSVCSLDKGKDTPKNQEGCENIMNWNYWMQTNKEKENVDAAKLLSGHENKIERNSGTHLSNRNLQIKQNFKFMESSPCEEKLLMKNIININSDVTKNLKLDKITYFKSKIAKLNISHGEESLLESNRTSFGSISASTVASEDFYGYNQIMSNCTSPASNTSLPLFSTSNTGGSLFSQYGSYKLGNQAMFHSTNNPISRSPFQSFKTQRENTNSEISLISKNQAESESISKDNNTSISEKCLIESFLNPMFFSESNLPLKEIKEEKKISLHVDIRIKNRNLRIEVNKNDNPFTIAREFCGQNHLNEKYITTIGYYINKAMRKVDEVMEAQLDEKQIELLSSIMQEIKKTEVEEDLMNSISYHSSFPDSSILDCDEIVDILNKTS